MITRLASPTWTFTPFLLESELVQMGQQRAELIITSLVSGFCEDIIKTLDAQICQFSQSHRSPNISAYNHPTKANPNVSVRISSTMIYTLAALLQIPQGWHSYWGIFGLAFLTLASAAVIRFNLSSTSQFLPPSVILEAAIATDRLSSSKTVAVLR